MLEWHFILALLAAVAVIAFAILYVRDKRNASRDEPARDDHDDVKMERPAEAAKRPRISDGVVAPGRRAA